MGEKQTLSEYLEDIRRVLEEVYGEYFYFSGANDMPAVRDWYLMGIEPTFVLLALSDETIKRKFSLSDIRDLVKKKFKHYALKEAREARSTLREEPIPHAKVEKLYKIVKSILLELEVEDHSFAERLLELQELDNLFDIERELYELEKLFYRILASYSPYVSDCERLADKLVSPYSAYWERDVIALTKSSIIRECLKKKHGVPEFTLLP